MLGKRLSLPILLPSVLILFSCNGADSPVSSAETPQEQPGRELRPAAVFTFRLPPAIAEFEQENMHVTVYKMWEWNNYTSYPETEMIIDYDTSGLQLSGSENIVTRVVARRDTLYGMNSAGQLLSVLPNAINTSALRYPDDADSLLYIPGDRQLVQQGS